MKYVIKRLILVWIIAAFCGCSDNNEVGGPGTLSGASLLSFSVLYNGSYYDLQQLTIGSREDEEDESWYD